MIDRQKPVLVTGATGYVAGQLIKKLLQEGLSIHATVRDVKNEKKLKYLKQLSEQSVNKIKFYSCDLLKEGSFDEAAKDCELIFHTASPFNMNVKDPHKDLIEPALMGTKNVLGSVNKSAAAKRVVLTSSCAAIVGDAIECTQRKNTTENEWNETSSAEHQPYSYSKTLAEKEAWKIVRSQKQWDMVTVNPSLVIGPGINPNATSESYKIIQQIGNGTYRFGAPEFFIGVVDVRDVATAHYLAGFTSEAQGRYITSAENTSIMELCQHLIETYGNKYPFPQKITPKWLVWAMGPLFGFTRKMIKLNIGYPWNVDSSKSINELGLSYRPAKDSINEFFQHAIDNQLIK